MTAEYISLECEQNSVTCVAHCYQYKYPHGRLLLRLIFPLDFSAVLHELSAIDLTLRQMYLFFNYRFLLTFTADMNFKQLHVSPAANGRGAIFCGAADVKVSEMHCSRAAEGS